MNTTRVEPFSELDARVRKAADQKGMEVEPYTWMLVERTLKPVRRKPSELTPEEYDAARWRLERHFGKGHGGDPHAGDNERIDADLAKEYINSHEAGA